LTSPNWSGGIFFPSGAGEQVKTVYAQWAVPNPLPARAGVSVFHCASWVGIDGWEGTSGANVLFQAGVECDIDATGTPTIYPWFEWVPADSYEREISNVSVKVGDVVRVGIQGEGPSNFTSGFVTFYNLTNGEHTSFGVYLPGGLPPLAGSSAEWIVERPEKVPEGGYWDLANYGSVTFDNAEASTTFAGVLYDPSEGQPMNMVDGAGNVMSIASNPYRVVTCLFATDALPA
jgi:hypothetical protein